MEDYKKRKLEINIIDGIIIATKRVGSKYFSTWDRELCIMQWLYNQRQGVVLAPLDEGSLNLLVHIITDGCDEGILYKALVWLVDHAEVEDGQ